MRKLICVMIAAMFVVCMTGCQVTNGAMSGAESKESVSGTSEADKMQEEHAEQEATQATASEQEQSTAIPAEEVKKPYGTANTDEEARAIAEEYYRYNWPEETFNEAKDLETFRYAYYAEPSDLALENPRFGVNDDGFNAAPYNMYIVGAGTNEIHPVKTNRQLVDEISAAKVENYGMMAGDFLTTYIDYEPKEDATYYEDDFIRVAAPELASVLANRERLSSKDAWFRQDVATFYNSAYVYQSTNGTIRARVKAAICLREASDLFFEENPEQKKTVNEWHVHEYEVEMTLDENEKISEYAIYELCQPYAASMEETLKIEALMNK